MSIAVLVTLIATLATSIPALGTFSAVRYVRQSLIMLIAVLATFNAVRDATITVLATPIAADATA